MTPGSGSPRVRCRRSIRDAGRPRERWQPLVDVRAAADRVLRAVSHGLGVDLTASPMPRVDASDDREVAPTRRNYLSPADVRGLPFGVWVESGPYSRGEWLARGVAGAAGRAAHLRVNDRSYLAVYEARSGAMWRLETTGRGAHHGLVAEGTADSFDEAKVAVRGGAAGALPGRRPGGRRRRVGAGGAAARLGADAGRPRRPHRGAGVRRAGVGDDLRPARAAAGRRGSASTASRPRARCCPPTAADARELAEAMARGQLMALAALAPDRADAMVRELADAGTLTRTDLDRIARRPARRLRLRAHLRRRGHATGRAGRAMSAGWGAGRPPR